MKIKPRTPFIFVLLAVFLVLFVLINIRGSNKNKTLSNQLEACNTKLKNPAVCNNQFQETLVSPLINGSKLTTPIITRFSNDGTGFFFTTTLLPGWEYGNKYFPLYSFTSYENPSYVATYGLDIKNINNSRYMLSFGISETEYANCKFTEPDGTETNFDLTIPTYTEIQTGFGVARYGKHTREDGSFYYIVCQNIGNSNPETGWGTFTNIGSVYLQVPNEPDPELFREMIEMIRSVKLSRV